MYAPTDELRSRPSVFLHMVWDSLLLRSVAFSSICVVPRRHVAYRGDKSGCAARSSTALTTYKRKARTLYKQLTWVLGPRLHEASAVHSSFVVDRATGPAGEVLRYAVPAYCLSETKAGRHHATTITRPPTAGSCLCNSVQRRRSWVVLTRANLLAALASTAQPDRERGARHSHW